MTKKLIIFALMAASAIGAQYEPVLRTKDATGTVTQNIDFTGTVELNGSVLASLAGGTYTGQINFSGTDHAGIKVLSLTTAQRDALTPAEGMIIYNTTAAEIQGYSNGSWVALDGAGGGGGGGDLWSDPVDAVITPDADGTRDLATTSTRFATGYFDNIDITSNIVVGGTVDGRDVATDGTKLDGIEALADVTDTANVTAAGALMDSEVDADIQTFSLPASVTISAFGATVVDDADAATARTTLGVDAAGTDNSTNVTLAGAYDYLTLSSQTITLTQVDLAADVTGNLPVTNLNGGTGATASTYWRGDGTWATATGGGDAWSDPIDVSITVDTNLAYDIGAAGARLDDVFAGKFNATGTSTTGDIVPQGDSNYDLGTNTVRWAQIYGDNLTLQTATITGTITATGLIDEASGVDLAASGDISVDGVDIIEDTAGTTTLSNIDAIDITTEAAIEAVVELDDLQGNLSVSHLNSGTGATASTFWRGDGTWATPAAGGSTFADNVFQIEDNGDSSKALKFEVSNITTSTTRTITVPDGDIDLSALTDPNDDRIAFWDDDQGKWGWLDPDGTNFSIVATSFALATDGVGASHIAANAIGQSEIASGSVQISELGISDEAQDVIVFFDDSAGAINDLKIGSGLAITGDTISAEVTTAELDDLVFQVAFLASGASLATGDDQGVIVIPGEFTGTYNLVQIHAQVKTAGTGSTTTFQIHNETDTADMLSTVVSIDASEVGSNTAATAYVVNTATDDVTAYDRIRIDVDSVASTVAPLGTVIVTLRFRKQ